MNAIVKLMRPEQWTKNFFVAAPLFFSGQMLDLRNWCQVAVAFIAFSLIASSIYCFNDIKDVESDRLHPKKRKRPVASGSVSVGVARLMMVVLLAGSLGCCFLMGDVKFKAIGVLLIYWILNLAYCVSLKHYAIIDVFIVSFGFVLRLILGGIVCDIWLSPWIVCMTFLIALFLAFAKRRDDVVIFQQTGVLMRKNITSYNLDFLNQVLGLIGAITIVCYIIFTVSREVEERMGSEYVYATSIFVLAGILRYLQVAIVDAKSGSPTGILLHDKFIQVCIIMWVITFGVIIYL